MSEQQELITTERDTPQESRNDPQNPLSIIADAIGRGADPDVLDKLLTLQERYSAGQSRDAYNRAIVDFQSRCPIIPKADIAYDKRFARIDRIWRTIRPLIAECGLAVTWESCLVDGDTVAITGHLMHRDGHSVAINRTMPVPELLKGMNSMQRAGSAETYAKRYAACSVLGIQTGEDDDGAGGKPPQPCAKPETLEQLRGLIEAKGSNESDIVKWAKVATLDEIPEAKAQAAVRTLRAR